MTLFLRDDALALRKEQLQRPDALGGLALSLQRELHNALDVPVPDGKARMTRYGGRCASCTVLLSFDPRAPHAHTCPSCGTVYTDDVHHQWWLMNAHLWTAEQCTRAAVLAHLLDDERAGQRADTILEAYSHRYVTWPNRDNVLGPTRPFFSTYLESIWHVHLATAAAFRARSGAANGVISEFRDRVIAPSAALIESYNEGRSNRQVWNVAALLAAGGVLGDTAMQRRAASPLIALLRDGLHTDGSWYEGENYQLFAHRGLLTGVTLAEQAGIELPADLVARFDAGFEVPFRTMLPDGTFPARRDSQYGVALRQYRTADWAECGFARRDTPEMRAALASLYASWPAEGDTGRRNSTADAERNQPGVRLRRADCNWRALLLAQIELPELSQATPTSELLEGQGLAVFRRQGGDRWVALDYGDPGDGHGHPDRLNLVIATRDARWLDDVGTGSYTSPTLSWYRSSMAHNAPMVNGRDQGAAHGALLAHDERGDEGWVSAEFTDPVSGVRFVRTVVVTNDYILDDLSWSSDVECFVDLPIQAALDADATFDWQRFQPATAQDAMLDEPRCATIGAHTSFRLKLRALPSPVRHTTLSDVREFECLIVSDTAAVLWRAGTIGPPAGGAHGLTVLRQTGTSGRSVRVLAATGIIAAASLAHIGVVSPHVDHRILVSLSGGSTHEHQRVATGWRVTQHSTSARDAIQLSGLRTIAPARPVAHRQQKPPTKVIPVERISGKLVGFSIASLDQESLYRRTEATWREAGEPTASFAFDFDDDRITVALFCRLGRAPNFAPPRAENPLDNEPADVNSDGAQLHWRSAVTGEWNSVLAVPEGSSVRLTLIDGSFDGISASYRVQPNAFLINFTLPWPESEPEFVVDACINECPPDRERRRGQLVMSGARGAFAYLLGARQSDAHAFHLVLPPVAP
jgi:Heparinase II/III-like protein